MTVKVNSFIVLYKMIAMKHNFEVERNVETKNQFILVGSEKLRTLIITQGK